MNELTTYRWSFEEDVERYVDAGYEGIGVWRQKIVDFGPERGAELLADSGLRVTNLQWAGGFTGSEAYSFDEGVSDARVAIELAAALQAGCLVVHPGARNNHTFRHAERLFRSAMERLLPLAESRGVTLAIEPMHPACGSQCTFLNEVEAALTFVESFSSPRLKLVYDTYHFGPDEAVLANLCELAPHIGIVQLGDLKTPHDIDEARCPLGEGKVQLAEIVGRLIEAGYDGAFDIELIGGEIETIGYEETLRASRIFFDQILAPAVGQ